MDTLTLTRDDKTLHLDARGHAEAPPILFLHGFPEYRAAWAPVAERLSDSYRCLMPDQRGYGLSWRGGAVADYAVKHLAADAIAMIDTFCGGRATVAGHDWGASVAYAVAMRAPERVSQLIIANGAHPVTFQRALAAGGAQAQASSYIDWLRAPGSEEALAKDGFARMFGFFERHMNTDWLTPATRAAYARAWRDAAGVGAMVNWYRATPLQVAKPGAPLDNADLPPWNPAALRVSMAHLLLWGMQDKALLPEARAGLDAFCDDLTVKEHAQADHWIIHQEPDWVARHMRMWLAEKSA
ncbi:MAG: alpha/beta fold hydrolase [Pseudomonadota bacterium]